MSAEPALPIANNQQKHRFEIVTSSGTAMAEYQLENNTIRFTHTEVPVPLRKTGLASRLVEFALNDSRTNGYEVIAECPFVAKYIRIHPEYADLLKR